MAHARMDRDMYGCTDGYMFVWMDGWLYIDGYTCVDARMDTYGWMDGYMNGCIDGCTDVCMDICMDVWMDICMHI